MGELSITNWFEYDPNVSDLDNVFRFVESLPQKFALLFSADILHLDDIIKRANVPSITSELLYKALQESKIAVEEELREKRRELEQDDQKKRQAAEDKYIAQLKSIGYTGNSLLLKATLLDGLWDKVKNMAHTIGTGFIDISQHELLSQFINFLTFLNTTLASLTNVFVSLESLKETKEVLESLLSVGG